MVSALHRPMRARSAQAEARQCAAGGVQEAVQVAHQPAGVTIGGAVGVETEIVKQALDGLCVAAGIGEIGQ